MPVLRFDEAIYLPTLHYTLDHSPSSVARYRFINPGPLSAPARSHSGNGSPNHASSSLPVSIESSATQTSDVFAGSFWQQLPPRRATSHPSFPIALYLNDYYSYAMEPPNIVIGHASRYANGVQGPARRRERIPHARAPRMVDTYIDGEFIQQVPFFLLVRFSKRTQEAYPRPSAPANQAESRTGVPETMDFKLGELWDQPPLQAFVFAFEWMNEAHVATSGSRDQPLPLFGVEGSTDVDLDTLVDYYTAALCLDLRPHPQPLKEVIYDRLTGTPPSIRDIRSLHERLPVSDRIITRMLTSYIQSRMNLDWYTPDGRQEIEEYIIHEDFDLRRRYFGIQRDHNRKLRATQRGVNASGRRGNADVPGRPVNINNIAAPHTDVPHETIGAVILNTEAAPGDNQAPGGGSRRRRGKRHGRGLGRDGQPVPGANY